MIETLPANAERPELPIRTRLWTWLSVRPWLLLPLLAIPALLPLLTEGAPRTLDRTLHLLRIASLDRHLRSGVFLPRWQPELLLGYGYPALNYYAPASYYIVELLHLAGMSLSQGFALAMAGAVLVAGFGMYALAMDVFDRRMGPALVAAVAYMATPYLMVNLYNRGALAEAGAQALLPWLLWSARRLLTSERPGLPALLLTLTLAALATMHTISLLFAPFLLVAWLLVIGLRAGRLRAGWPWVVGSILAAMAASAFFWLPLLLERDYLSARALEIARQVGLVNGAWGWDSVVQPTAVYEISTLRPLRLGLAQVLLAAAGFLIARRRDAEWLFWLAVAVVVAALIGAWSLPLWSSTILVVAQFPWRLLGILSLPLALFAGGIAYGTPAGWPRTVATAGTIVLILLAQTPRPRDLTFVPAETVRADLAVLAMADLDKGAASGGEGTSSVQEFRPRWAATTLELESQPEAAGPSPQVHAIAANAYDLDLTYTSESTTTLRFSTFHFPGWRVLLDGDLPLETRPETHLGLLSATVPAGEHVLRIVWQGTWVERAANLLSLVAWLLLGLLCLRSPRLRRWSAIPLALFVVGFAGLLWVRRSTPVQPPLSDPSLPGVRLLGAQFDVRLPAQASVRPFWQITEPLADDMQFHWQLQSLDGAVLANYRARPYFNTLDTGNWAVNSVVDDGALLPLPAGLAAGEYRLGVDLAAADEPLAPLLEPALTFTLDAPVPADPRPAQVTRARFGDLLDFAGFTLTVNGREVDPSAQPAVVRPGDRIEYTLHWRPLHTIREQYRTFVHLVDVNGVAVLQHDHAPGPMRVSPGFWLPDHTHTDRYRFYIPDDAPSGLLYPRVGMYTHNTQERVQARADGQTEKADFAALPPIKVLAEGDDESLARIDVAMDRFGTLSGYSVIAPQTVMPGATITVTLRYRGETPTTKNLTRFLHLYSAQSGMAAQRDGLPQNGANPTWSWAPEETIVERVALTIDAGAQAGVYTLYAGFYDFETGQRAPLAIGGVPVVDNAVPLAEIEVHEGG